MDGKGLNSADSLEGRFHHGEEGMADPSGKTGSHLASQEAESVGLSVKPQGIPPVTILLQQGPTS